MQKSFAVAALLAASCGAQAASDADLAAIRSQIDEMKKTYEQRIAALEQKLAQAETRASAEKPEPAPVQVESRQSVAAANAFNPEVSLILQGQYRNAKDVPGRAISGSEGGRVEDASQRDEEDVHVVDDRGEIRRVVEL